MTDQTLSPHSLAVLTALARQREATVDALILDLVEVLLSDIDRLPPRPADSLTDDLIEIPPYFSEKAEDIEEYREAARAFAPKLYAIARAYWLKHGDLEHFAMTDTELDKTLWLIDHEGRPRFFDERGSYTPPPDPLEDFFAAVHSADWPNVPQPAASPELIAQPQAEAEKVGA